MNGCRKTGFICIKIIQLRELMVLILINLWAAHTYTKEDDKRDQYFLCIGLPIIYKVTAKLRNA